MVLLALDEAPISAAEAGVFGLAHLVECLAEMADDVELVEQDRRLRRFVLRDVAERLPHVHHGELDFAALLDPQPVEDAPLAASERSSPPNQIGRLRTKSLTTMR